MGVLLQIGTQTEVTYWWVCSFRSAHKLKWHVPIGVLLQIGTQTEVTCTDGCAPSDRHTNRSDMYRWLCLFRSTHKPQWHVQMGVLLQIGTQTKVTWTDGCAPSDRRTNQILCHLMALHTEVQQPSSAAAGGYKPFRPVLSSCVSLSVCSLVNIHFSASWCVRIHELGNTVL